MKKYKIELSEEQMIFLANCLEDVSRFASGQCELRYTIETMNKGLPFDEFINRREKYEPLLEELKTILLPDLSKNESLGYNGTDFIGNTYQIYRTIRHRIAVDNNHKNVYSSEALPSGTMGTIKIEKI